LKHTCCERRSLPLELSRDACRHCGFSTRRLAYDDLIFPKTPRKLPAVLSPDEVTRMIEAAPSLLHRTILMVLYATGIRRTEASLLKVSNIDSERMVIHVRQGKGSRDRDVPMTPKLLQALREYWRWKRPKIYLFPSTAGHRGVEQPISDHTIRCDKATLRGGRYHPQGREQIHRTLSRFADVGATQSAAGHRALPHGRTRRPSRSMRSLRASGYLL
jgi:integrase/recombinase XerD